MASKPDEQLGEFLELGAETIEEGDGDKFREEVAKAEAAKAAAEAQIEQAKNVLPRGTKVVIDGLQSRADLNGQTGLVVTYVEEKGRYKVRIKDGSSIAVKPENITVVPKTASAAAEEAPQRESDQRSVALPEHMQKDFMDQQKKLTNAGLHLETIEERLERQIVRARRVEYTKVAIEKEDDATLYTQCGRCFIQQDKPTIVAELDQATTKYRAQIKKVKDSQQYYERRRDESSTALQEMMQNLQRMQQGGGDDE